MENLMKRWITLWLLLIGATFSGLVSAANLRVTFEIPYETGLFSDKPNEETRNKIMPTARMEVWKNYVGRQDSSSMALIEKNNALLQSKLDEIVTNIEFVDEQVLKDQKRMKFVVRAVVNDNKVSSLIAGASGDAKSGEGSAFGFLVVPRIQDEVKSFDATVVKKATASTKMVNEKINAEQVKETDGGASERSLEGDKVSMTATAKTSGSTTRKSQKVKWRLGEAKDVDANISKVLTEAGYEPSDYASLASDPECASTIKTQQVREEYLASEAELNEDVRGQVFQASRKCDIRFFALGTLDFDSIDRDRNSGGWRARATVNIKVHDLKRRGAPTVASVGPVDYYGVGPQEDGARSDALKLAAKEAAQIIVNQLRAKNLR
jgi:hypothetical protein